MAIYLEPIGLLRRYCRGLLNAEDRIELNDNQAGRSLAAVCQDAGIPLEMISLFVVNAQVKTRAYELQAGDTVKCVAIIGGG